MTPLSPNDKEEKRQLLAFGLMAGDVIN